MTESEILAEIEKAEREIYIPAVMKVIHDNFDAVYRMKQRPEPSLMNVEDIKIPAEWLNVSSMTEWSFLITEEMLVTLGDDDGEVEFSNLIKLQVTRLCERLADNLLSAPNIGCSLVLRSSVGLKIKNDPCTGLEMVAAELCAIRIASSLLSEFVDNGVLEKVERDDR